MYRFVSFGLPGGAALLGTLVFDGDCSSGLYYFSGTLDYACAFAGQGVELCRVGAALLGSRDYAEDQVLEKKVLMC